MGKEVSIMISEGLPDLMENTYIFKEICVDAIIQLGSEYIG